MLRKKIFIHGATLGLLFIFLSTFMLSFNSLSAKEMVITEDVELTPLATENNVVSEGDVFAFGFDACVTTTGDFPGRKTPPHQGIMEFAGCEHNVVYEDGFELLEQMAQGVSRNLSLLILCNSTAGATATADCGDPVTGQTEAFTTLNSCGLAPTNGSFASNDITYGNWSITNTFTNTCDVGIRINATRLGDNTGTGRNLSGLTITSTTMNLNDQTTINLTNAYNN